jgi:hypothetical protein
MKALAIVALLAGGCQLDLYPEHGTGEEYSTADYGEIRPDAPPRSDAARELSPILHYRFDDSLASEGTLGAGYAGTGTNITYVAGKRGKAVAFDTTRDTKVLLPTQVPLSNHDSYTVGLWFREDVVWDSGGFTQYLFNNRGAGGFETYHGAGGAQALTTCSDAGCKAVGYSVGPWHHLAYRYAGTDTVAAPLEIYIDGVLATSLPASTIFFSSTQTSITLGTRTNMQVDDLMVFSQALTAAELCSQMIGGTWTGTACTIP